MTGMRGNSNQGYKYVTCNRQRQSCIEKEKYFAEYLHYFSHNMIVITTAVQVPYLLCCKLYICTFTLQRYTKIALLIFCLLLP